MSTTKNTPAIAALREEVAALAARVRELEAKEAATCTINMGTPGLSYADIAADIARRPAG